MTVVEEVKIPAPELRGGNFELGACRDIEVCLDGAAGTGKTVACLYKVHMLLTMHPGAKALVARKTNTALAGSAMATFQAMLDPREGVVYYGGSKVKPAAFQYPNGSLMIVSGLDKPEKIKSFEFDLAYLNEATEMTLEDIEFVRSRLRNGKTPYHQLIMDTNPDAPTHWLNQRMNDGTTTRLLSRHEDNPRYFNLTTKDWTDAGREYIFGILGGLTGVRLSRLRYGMWSASSGTVYEQDYDRARNVIDSLPLKREWPRYLAIDFGYTNPFCCLWAAQDGDGRLIVYRQIYLTKKLVEEHARQIAILSGWFHLLPKDHPQRKDQPAEWADPLPRHIICDHDAEGRATLEAHLNLATTAAKKTISDGIQAVAIRLRSAGDGQPRLKIFRDCLKERDEELAKRKQPTSVIEEFDTYIWKKGADLAEKEEPVDASNHGLDALRYLIAHHDLQPNSVSYFKDIWR